MPLRLRPAALADRRDIYRWLAQSDATAEMMGPPRFADHPVPSYEEFCADYDDSAYLPSGPFRLYVMEINGQAIGAISSFTREWVSEIDLWIGGRAHWGKGYGSTAIEMLASGLFASGEAETLLIRPSARNARAVAAYRKAGFVPYDPLLHRTPGWITSEGLDYEDAVILVRPKP